MGSVHCVITVLRNDLGSGDRDIEFKIRLRNSKKQKIVLGVICRCSNNGPGLNWDGGFV